MEWYVKLGLLVFTALIGIPYLYQKISPVGKDHNSYLVDMNETGYAAEMDPNDVSPFEPQHSDVTIMRKRQRKKREYEETATENTEK